MHRVVVLALDGVIPFELGIPSRIFGEAVGADGEPLYEVIVCTVDGRPVTSSAGYTLGVEHDAEALAGADTVVIPPSHALGPVRENIRLPQPLAAALSRIRPGSRIASICTASYVLAAAGLLDDRPATTHWREAEHFQRTFPHVKVDPGVLFVDDGDVLTSAGAAAGVDLCLHMIRRDHGSEIANQVARGCVVPPWRHGGQAQYIERPIPQPSQATTADTRAWALQHLDQPVTLPELAAHARTSVRTFTRRFRHEVGMTPGQWLIRQRVERARHLLESSDLAIDQIADQSGFGAPSSFRQHFRAIIGVSPADYRRTFHAET
ncbi:MAG: helix-turn-helix domain-containing protein [Hamadaea sp.]|nr:helix-turn-helix domain-containing protein [Hamadaea sp.]NUS00503.1 helix-turn-helix domain-containing protein [Kribbellaceae bacterium]NUT03949.1 helix-turn-helix domain-containing protein [Hamadaea sp.]